MKTQQPDDLRREERRKKDSEVAIEQRWRDKLLESATAQEFGQAYDELHREFLRQQSGPGTGVGPNASASSAQADIYATVNPRSGAEDRVRAVLLRVAGSGKRILEVGTGDGLTAYLLARAGNVVTSIDVSEVALAHARMRYGGRSDGSAAGDGVALDLSYAMGDARELTYPEGCFDLVVSENVVEHLSLADMGRHLDEVYRVLKPGGSYLLYTPSRLWSGRVSAGFHLHVYTLRELCALLREVGLTPAWIEPRLLHRTGRLLPVSGLGLKAVMAYEALLQVGRVHRWPYALKARVIPGVMVVAQRATHRGRVPRRTRRQVPGTCAAIGGCR
jgi:2-polyprenyl-3-methyl-5-hydroxy-6-metoxy-1,4-benzoquinol methylase